MNFLAHGSLLTLMITIQVMAANSAQAGSDWAGKANWYYLELDKFSNGDRDNDPEDRATWEPLAPGAPAYFGGDFEGLLKEAEGLREIGFDALIVDLKIPDSHPLAGDDAIVPVCYLSATEQIEPSQAKSNQAKSNLAKSNLAKSNLGKPGEGQSAREARADFESNPAARDKSLASVLKALHGMGFRVVLAPPRQRFSQEGWQTRITSKQWFEIGDASEHVDGWAIPLDYAGEEAVRSLRRSMQPLGKDAVLLGLASGEHADKLCSPSATSSPDTSKSEKPHSLAAWDGILIPEEVIFGCHTSADAPAANGYSPRLLGDALASLPELQPHWMVLTRRVDANRLGNVPAEHARSDFGIRAAALLAAFPNPVVEAGAEAGVPVRGDRIQPRPVNLRAEAFEEFRELHRIFLGRRREHPSLQVGEYRFEAHDESKQLIVFTRRHENEVARIYVNYGDESRRETLTIDPHQLAALLSPQIRYLPKRKRPFFVGGSRQRADALGRITFPIAPRSIRIVLVGFDESR